MKVLIGCLMLVVIAIAAALAWPLVSSPSQRPKVAISAPSATSFHYISMEDAAENVLKQAAEWYGLPQPSVYDRSEGEGAACPSHVLARKGQIFWCQALLEGKLVPVEMELISSLGFFRVLRVGENVALWNQVQRENQEAIEAEEEEVEMRVAEEDEERQWELEEQQAQEAECHEGWRQAVFEECLSEVRALHG